MLDIAPKLSPEEYETNFYDIRTPLSESAAVVEAGRCLYCYDAPCTTACPTHIDVPGFIKKIMTQNYRGSARTILEANILGESCSRACPVEVLCEGACVMNEKDERPIQIGKLQRFATEWRKDTGADVFEVREPNGKSVGLVGAGPASLSCAAYLVQRGYAADIYEAEDIPGGLDATGIAAYKLRAGDILGEIDMIKGLGVKIKTGIKVGAEISVETLLERHDALFIGVGLGRTRRLQIPGIELDGVLDALSFIKQVKLHPFGAVDVGRRVLVVGGGNTAVDAATAAKRLGAEEVTIIYRRSESEMPAFQHEYEMAKNDGVVYRWLTAPVEIKGRGGVESVTCVRMTLDGSDESGRRRPVPVNGSEFSLPADMVLLALGQSPDEKFLQMLPGVKITGGTLVADAGSGQTSNPRIFAGGDLVHGAKEVVDAVQAGKLAATGIDSFLSSEED